MNKKLLIFLLLFCIKIKGQNISLQSSGIVPAYESSGIETINHTTFWVHNDSGGQPELYEIDSAANLLKTLRVVNASNVDWEDITSDDEGHIYIGDFGNNANTRTDLRIYKINNPDSIATDSTYAQKIKFSLSDQTDFPPSSANLNFDIEAFIWFKDLLYLFSKNRSTPFNGYTKCYRLPDTVGTYIAELVDSFYGGSGSAWDYQITAADISPDKKQLFLLSHARAWIFSCFTGSDFFSGSKRELEFSFDTQKEAVCYANDSIIYITDEYGTGNGGFLYYTNLSEWSYKPYVFLGNDTIIGDSIILNAGNMNCQYSWSTGDSSRQISVGSSGSYWVNVTTLNGCSVNDTIQIQKVIFSSINNVDYKSIQVYPNPADNYITITGLQWLQANSVTLELLNMQGMIIWRTSLIGDANKNYCIFPEKIPNGLYSVHVFDSNNQYTQYISIVSK